jgi:hypothetical protein
MPEREREGASGTGGTISACERGTPCPGAKPPKQRARRAFGRLVATPTFIAGASFVIVATLAYGTTQTHLLYSGMGPACASASCTVASPQAAGGQPNAASATRGTVGGRDSRPGTGTGANAGTSGSSSQRGGSPSGQTEPRPGSGQPSPGSTASAGSAKSRVVIVYRTLRNRHNGFTAAITITNHSTRAIKGWQLWMRYKASRIGAMWGVRWFPVSQHARGIGTAVPEPTQQTLKPGATVRFTFQADGSPGAPSGCVFDGDHCNFSRS